MPDLGVERPFPWALPTSVEQAGADTGNSTGTVITASSTANAKGSWIQLIASTSKKTVAILCGFAAPNANSLLDIGTGTAGSETVLVANIQSPSNNQNSPLLLIALRVPSGTRIAARSQIGTSGAASVKLICYLMEVD